MFGSLLGVVTDVAKITVAPVAVAADLTRAVTQPLAEVAEEIVDSVKEAVDQR